MNGGQLRPESSVLERVAEGKYSGCQLTWLSDMDIQDLCGLSIQSEVSIRMPWDSHGATVREAAADECETLAAPGLVTGGRKTFAATRRAGPGRSFLPSFGAVPQLSRLSNHIRSSWVGALFGAFRWLHFSTLWAPAL